MGVSQADGTEMIIGTKPVDCFEFVSIVNGRLQPVGETGAFIGQKGALAISVPIR